MRFGKQFVIGILCWFLGALTTLAWCLVILSTNIDLRIGAALSGIGLGIVTIALFINSLERLYTEI